MSGEEPPISTARAPGWYPDPFERLPLRWWDGGQWTEYAGHDSRGGSVQWDPAPFDEASPPPPGLPGLIAAVVGCVAGVILAFLLRLVFESAGEPGGRAAELGVSSLGLWSGVIGACVFVSRRRGSGSLVRDYAIRFRWLDLGLGLAGSVAGRVVAGIMLAPVPFPSRRLSDVDESAFEAATQGASEWIVLILITCVGAPLVEEIFFRGLLQTRLVGRFGVVPGVIGSSLVFGAAHLIAWNGPMTLAYAWAVTGGGLVLGTMYHYSGRLGTPILGHAFFNAQAMLVVALLS